MSKVVRPKGKAILVSTMILILIGLVVGCSNFLTDIGNTETLNNAGNEPVLISWTIKTHSSIRTEGDTDWQRFYDENYHEYTVDGYIDLDLLIEFTENNVGDFEFDDEDDDDDDPTQVAQEGTTVKIKDGKVKVSITIR